MQLLKFAVVIKLKFSLAKYSISEHCYLTSNHIQIGAAQ